MSKLSSYWNVLGGKINEFSLQERIFHAVSLASTLMLGLSMVINYTIGLRFLSGLMIFVGLSFSLAYFFSRVRRKYTLALTIFFVISNIALIINYRYNSGISGPTYAIFLLFFVMSIAISPMRQYKIWLPLNVLTVLSLIAYEFSNPSFISGVYSDRTGRFIDFGFSYIAIAAMALMIAIYIFREFNRIHNLSEQKNRELQHSNDTKNKLLSIMAHDLKDPLASIQSFLELLNEFDLSLEERESIERQLLNRTKETSFLLSNLLSWTKGQMDRVSVKTEAINLRKFVDRTLAPLREVSQEKNIRINTSICRSHHILADENMLQIVLRNLVNNALKFSNPGTEIQVSTELMGRECRISIADQGLGMSQEKQKTIFSAAGSSTFGTANERGAGLGLLLCRDFIDYQAGKIGFSSIEGSGSTFFVQMPVADVPVIEINFAPEAELS